MVKLTLVAMLLAVSLVAASDNGVRTTRLVFLGTVTGIQQVNTVPSLKPFLVTTSVDKVLEGRFSGSRFQFVVHSPAQSGLQVGNQYTIQADWTAAGYIVDELQWRRR